MWYSTVSYKYKVCRLLLLGHAKHMQYAKFSTYTDGLIAGDWITWDATNASHSCLQQTIAGTFRWHLKSFITRPLSQDTVIRRGDTYSSSGSNSTDTITDKGWNNLNKNQTCNHTSTVWETRRAGLSSVWSGRVVNVFTFSINNRLLDTTQTKTLWSQHKIKHYDHNK